MYAIRSYYVAEDVDHLKGQPGTADVGECPLPDTAPLETLQQGRHGTSVRRVASPFAGPGTAPDGARCDLAGGRAKASDPGRNNFV